jgi:hypothetical protein
MEAFSLARELETRELHHRILQEPWLSFLQLAEVGDGK